MRASEAERAARELFACRAIHSETVHVREEYGGRVLWEGDVSVVDLEGHPSAPRAYLLRVVRENGDACVYPLLHAGLVTSPECAVRAAVVHEAAARERLG